MGFSAAFRTRDEIIKCKNLPTDAVALCALDIGYSAVKGYSANSRFCIPSYVRECSAEAIGTPKPTDIRYRGEDGVVYAVGGLALETLSGRDTNDAANTMFGRNRYFSTQFLVLARVGLAIGIGNKDSRPICLQTGLPPAYRKADTALVEEALAGTHKFSVKIGNKDWEDYEFTLDADSIFVMDQPIGSVYSAVKRNDGTTVPSDDGKTYIDHQLLVFDGGFGTLDIFSVRNRLIDGSNTFNDLGMRAVFEMASAEIFKQYGKEVHAHTLQKYLADGFIPVLDRKARTTKNEDIAEIMRHCSRQVCEKAIARIESAYDFLEDYDYLLVTGGTGAAWFDMLKERYKGMTTLKVISANQNEQIPAVYNNVRGYYIYRALATK